MVWKVVGWRFVDGRFREKSSQVSFKLFAFVVGVVPHYGHRRKLDVN
jgi:hypothetical protein